MSDERWSEEERVAHEKARELYRARRPRPLLRWRPVENPVPAEEIERFAKELEK